MRRYIVSYMVDQLGCSWVDTLGSAVTASYLV